MNALKNFYELSPRYDCRDSFYGKALVEECNNGKKQLYSYLTLVCEYNPKTKTAKIYNGYDNCNLTATTLRHIKEFLKQNNMAVGSKKELIKMYCGE